MINPWDKYCYIHMMISTDCLGCQEPDQGEQEWRAGRRPGQDPGQGREGGGQRRGQDDEADGLDRGSSHWGQIQGTEYRYPIEC